MLQKMDLFPSLHERIRSTDCFTLRQKEIHFVNRVLCELSYREFQKLFLFNICMKPCNATVLKLCISQFLSDQLHGWHPKLLVQLTNGEKFTLFSSSSLLLAFIGLQICELCLVEQSVQLLQFYKVWGMERILPEIVQIISCVNNAIFSSGQKENMKMPCFM